MARDEKLYDYKEEKTLNASVSIQVFEGSQKEMENFLSAEKYKKNSLKPKAALYYAMPISVGPHLQGRESKASKTQEVVDCRYYRAASSAWMNLGKIEQRKLVGPKMMSMAVVGARMAFSLYARDNYKLNQIQILDHTTTKNNARRFDSGYQFLVEKSGEKINDQSLPYMIGEDEMMAQYHENNEDMTGIHLDDETHVFVSDHDAIVVSVQLGNTISLKDLEELKL